MYILRIYYAFLILSFITTPLVTSAQILDEEVYFSVNNRTDIPYYLQNKVSIDRSSHSAVFCYASREVFKLVNNTTEHPHPGKLIKPKMAGNAKDLKNWDSYPTYPQYEAFCNNLQAEYPEICRVYSLGKTINNHEQLVIKLSDNVHDQEAEPGFLLASSIHGDELTGYVLSLRMAEYLCQSYGVNPEITALLDSIQIWIQPLINPDGAYYASDLSVYGARRFNSNFIDLNRNFPDPSDGPTPDYSRVEPENMSFISFFDTISLAISVCIHGGAEVLNYPWDTWQRRHADDSWLQEICRSYADTAHIYDPQYLTSFNNGITNGYDWYSIQGGRQDYLTFFRHSRDITFEISETKTPPATELPLFWTRNYRSVINMMKASVEGFHGIITDKETGAPVKSKIEIENHDFDNSHVYSDANTGRFSRLISSGNYDIRISSPGYEPYEIKNQILNSNEQVYMNISLQHSTSSPLNASVYPNPVSTSLHIITQNYNALNITVYDSSGKLVIMKDFQANEAVVLQMSNFKNGLYYLRIQSENKSATFPVLKVDLH